MPRMSPELLLSHNSYLNPLKDRELDLRGYQIPAIENLGVTKDSLDAIDLTDNSIRSLINLPKLNRLKHFYLSNNPLSFISPTLAQSLPNLNSLVLSNCSLNNFNQLFLILKQFKRLEFLVLIGNPVSKMKLYRDWCVYSCSRVRMLDYKRVKDQERKTSIELFYDPVSKGPTPLAQSLSVAEISNADQAADSTSIRSNHYQSAEPGQLGRTLTSEERDRIKRSIEDATSVEEVRRLKRMLEQGFIPRDDRKAPSAPEEETQNVVMAVDPAPESAPAPPKTDATPDVQMSEGGKVDETGATGPTAPEPVADKPTKKRASKAPKPKTPARATRAKAKQSAAAQDDAAAE